MKKILYAKKKQKKNKQDVKRQHQKRQRHKNWNLTKITRLVN
jgi:hypothetical protein